MRHKQYGHDGVNETERPRLTSQNLYSKHKLIQKHLRPNPARDTEKSVQEAAFEQIYKQLTLLQTDEHEEVRRARWPSAHRSAGHQTLAHKTG